MTENSDERDYDVALSFAGEQRDYVEQVAVELRAKGFRPFYDMFEEANLWGKDLYTHLDYVYQRAARYCIIFASADYANKMWTSHERQSAQARAIESSQEYILPARFDNTEIPGLRKTVGYIDLSRKTPSEVVELVASKLGPRQKHNFYPPNPDLLYAAMSEGDPVVQDYIETVSRSFYKSLRRMNVHERRVLFEIALEGCGSERPENVHISLDLLRRELDIAPAEILKILKGLSALGVEVKQRETNDHEENDIIEVQWNDFMVYDEEALLDYSIEMSTEIALQTLMCVSSDKCLSCALDSLERLDFSELSSTFAAPGHEEESPSSQES